MNGEAGMDVISVQAYPGETVQMDASETSDPDDDDLSYHWWNYREAEQFRGDPPAVEIRDSRSEQAAIEIPEDAEEREYHVILTVTDDGEPNLSRYRRVVLDVQS